MADDVGSMPVVVGMADGEADFMEDCAPPQKFPGLIVQLPALGDGSEELVGSGGNTLGLRVIDSGVIGEILNGPLTSVVAGDPSKHVHKHALTQRAAARSHQIRSNCLEYGPQNCQPSCEHWSP